jgi:4'-phosphopantetheinyl transferase EntD
VSYVLSHDPEDPTAQRLRAVLPNDIRFAFTTTLVSDEFRFPEELAFVERAVPKRQREFRTGRACARLALAELGVEPTALPMGEDRAPVWPPGVVGSITHCQGFVGAAVARASLVEGLGLDAELSTPLEPDVIRHICSEDEQASFAALPRRPEGADWSKIAFSAKESIHKCIAPRSRIMLDFRDVTVRIHPETSRFSARLNRADSALPSFDRIEGRFAVLAPWVFTTAIIASRASSSQTRG